MKGPIETLETLALEVFSFESLIFVQVFSYLEVLFLEVFVLKFRAASIFLHLRNTWLQFFLFLDIQVSLQYFFLP